MCCKDIHLFCLFAEKTTVNKLASIFLTLEAPIGKRVGLQIYRATTQVQR